MLENFEEYFAPSPAPLSKKNVVTRHSSMAPRADMLNFGPPCARGQYNAETRRLRWLQHVLSGQGNRRRFVILMIVKMYDFKLWIHASNGSSMSNIEDWKHQSSKMKKNYAENVEKTK